jgi:ATP-dependent Clp protease ATP-binding subunit ClpX
MDAVSRLNTRCSFCLKGYRDVGPVVEGPNGVYICGECAELCVEIVQQVKKRRASEVNPPAPNPDPPASN